MIWKARSIWLAGDEGGGDVFVSLRRRFRLGDRPRVAPAFVAATVPYRLFLNGAPLGRGPVAAPPGVRYFDSYDLAPYLQRGANVLAALCLYPAGALAVPAPCLQLQAAIERPGERPIEILTDETWMALRQPAAGGPAGGEVWRVDGDYGVWLRPEFEDALWLPAETLPVELPAPLPPPIPPLAESWVAPAREIEVARVEAGAGQAAGRVGGVREDELRAAPAREAVRGVDAVGASAAAGFSTLALKGKEPVMAGRRVFDFGRQVLGSPRLYVSEGAEGILAIRGGDALDSDGSVQAVGAAQMDQWVLQEARTPLELETFRPRSFRFLEVVVAEPVGTLEVERVEARQTLYPWERRGSFECSDETLTRVWALGRDTLAWGTRDTLIHYTSEAGPGWLGEARAQALVAYAAFGDARLIRKLLLETAGNLSPTRGGEQGSSELPSLRRGGAGGEVPPVLDEEASWVFLVWEYFRHTGDRSLLQELYPAVRARVSRLHDYTDEFGLLNTECPSLPRAAVWVDDAPLDRRGAVTAANAFYHRALLTAARIAACVADVPAQRELDHRAASLRNTANWRLWSERDRAYADCRTRHGLGQRIGAETNWLAIAFGLAESRRAAALRHRLAADEAELSEPSPFFQAYVLEALYALGDIAAARARISRLWGAMLDAGATTCWQSWPASVDSPPPRVSAPPRPRVPASPCLPAGSACWGPAAAPTYFLTAEVLGVRPVAPGWRRARVRPVLGELEWVRGIVPTPLGELAVECRRRGGRAVELKALVPAEMRVEIGLADVRAGDVVEAEGTVIWPTRHAHPSVELETLPRVGPDGWSWLVTGPREVRLRVRD